MRQVHGTLVRVAGSGVLLRGPAGSGKSDTALALIAAGHALVADDGVILQRQGATLMGTAPAIGQGLVYLRGPGLIDPMLCYGADAVSTEARVELLIDLAAERDDTPDIHGSWATEDLLGIPLPRLALAPERPVAALVPAAVAALSGRGRALAAFDRGRPCA